MEERLPYKPFIVSKEFMASRKRIYDYTCVEHGEEQAELYRQKIMYYVTALPYSYLQWQECWYLPTKSKMYRRIPMAAHHIVYRVTSRRIEVLDIIHQASSVSRFRAVRKIRL
jgi:plasmid stabilization system protein ParE